MRPQKLLRGGLVAAVGAAALAMAPSALAAPGDAFTWSPGLLATTQNWSDPGNWTATSGTDTTPSGTVNSLTFPALTCSGSPNPCVGYDDVGPLTANQLVIDTSTNYTQYDAGTLGTNPVTLAGNGSSPNVGLSTTYGNTVTGSSHPTAVFALPVLLTGPAQTWDVASGYLYVPQIGDAPRPATPLTLSLGGGGAFGTLQAVQITTAALALQGNGDLDVPANSGVSSPTLPPVTLSGTTVLTVATATTSGAIDASADTSGGVEVFGLPGSTLDITSGNLTLGSGDALDLDIDGNSAAQSTSVDVTSGSAALGGATLNLDQNFEAAPNTACTTLTPGTTVTLLHAAGGITGSLVVNGHSITQGQSATEPVLNSCSGPAVTAIVNYNANSITATIAGAPAVVAGHGPSISGGTTVGDTLTSNTGTWTGTPAPTYTYQWLANGSAINGATGSSYKLTSDDAGKTITLKVTATNAYGSASATSNALGPVQAAASTTTSNPSPPSTAVIRADLSRLSHPAGRRAIIRLLRHRLFRTHLSAPSSGTLKIVWRATVTTGRGRHAKRHTYVIATGSVHARGSGSVTVTIHLTGIGRRLLAAHLTNLRVTATERFRPTGSGWVTYTGKFTL